MARSEYELYRFYDDEGVLLYIGVSLMLLTRLDRHRMIRTWWKDVARIDVEHIGSMSRVEAERIERQAIAAEQPLHNMDGLNGLRPCGTNAAYMRHLRNGETPCDECVVAHRDQVREYWRAKRAK